MSVEQFQSDARGETSKDALGNMPRQMSRARERECRLAKPRNERGRCNADIEYGQRSSSLCYLVNIAREVGQVGKTLKWDPENERFTNCDEGNALLSRPRREGWELPA